MGKFTIKQVKPMKRQDFNTGEETEVSFKTDDGKVMKGYYLTLTDEKGQISNAQAWVLEGQPLYEDGQEVEGELVPAQDKQGNTYYKFKKAGQGGGFKKGGFAPRDYRKEALASAPTMTMSYAKDVVVALIAAGVIKKADDAQKQLLAIADATFSNAKTKIEESVPALPAPAPATETKPATTGQAQEEAGEGEGEEDAPQQPAPKRPINPDEDINIEDIPF